MAQHLSKESLIKELLQILASTTKISSVQAAKELEAFLEEMKIFFLTTETKRLAHFKELYTKGIKKGCN